VVEVLEAGTRLEAVLIGRWDRGEALEQFWMAAEADALFGPVRGVEGARIVTVRGLPADGLPDDLLPTIATVKPPGLGTPPAYMLVQGSVRNPGPIEKYVGIIMPMLRERSGYYVVYAQAAEVHVRLGHWSEQAFIISRWPTLEAARDFWWSRLYQESAIPARSGHGAFTVLLMPGQAG
jgi:uncharacterized protein (DUF1330 family)